MATYPTKKPARTFGLDVDSTFGLGGEAAVNPLARSTTPAVNPRTPSATSAPALAAAAPAPSATSSPVARAPAPAPAVPLPAPTAAASTPAPQSPVARYLGSDFRSLGLAPAAPAPAPAPAPAAATPVPAKAAVPAATTAPTPKALTLAPGATTPPTPIVDIFKPGPLPLNPPILDPHYGPRDVSVEGLDGLQRDTAWVLPKGQVVGYGGKLEHDVNDIYRTEYGREADAAGRDRHRAGLARGQMTPEQIRAELDATHEGQEFNLQHDPLDDAGFSRRLYSTLFGQEADEAERARLTSMLAQGREREDLLKELMESEAFKKSGRKLDQAAIDKVFGQGDTFEGELKNDDVEKQLAENFKRELGRAPTQRELQKYAEMVRSGKIKTEATDHTTPEQAAKTFYQTLFRAHPHGYQPSADEVEAIKGILAGPASQVDARLRNLIQTRQRGADFVSWGANTSANDVVNALSNLRHANTKSPLLEMLRARKAAGFADGGRVELQEDGTLKKINAKKVPSRPGDEKVRHPKDRTAGVRGRREENEEPDIFLNRGGRVKGYADGGRTGSDEQLRNLLRDYLVRTNPEQNQGDGGSGANADLSIFDNMSAAEMLRWAKGQQDPIATGLNRMGEIAIGDDDPMVQQFLQQHGARDWGNVEAPDSGNRAARGYVMGYGDPTYGREGVDGRSIVRDPGRILRLPDGRYIREEANIDSDEVAGQQRNDETQFRQNAQELGRVIAAPIAMAAGQYAGFIPAGDMSGVMAAAPGQGFGTAGATAGAPAGVATAGSQAPQGTGSTPARVDVPGDLPVNTGAPSSGAPLANTPSIQQGGQSMGSRLLSWAQANPQQAARLGLSVASLAGGSSGGGSSEQQHYSPGGGDTYTPGSGSSSGGYTMPIYTAPAPYVAPTYQPPPRRGFADGGRAASAGLGPHAALDDSLPPEVLAQLQATPEGRALLAELTAGNPHARGGNPHMAAARAGSATPVAGAGSGEIDYAGGSATFDEFANSGPMDARQLPNGEVVGRDDPRFFDAPAQGNPVGRAPRAGGDVPAPDAGNPVARGDAPPVARPQSSPSSSPSSNPMLDAYRASGVQPAPAQAEASATAPNIYTGTLGSSGSSESTMSTNTAAAGDPINDLLGVGREQIERYRRYDPIERQVIEEARRAGNAASQEEQAALAGEDVAGQFDRQRGMLRRRLGSDPGRAAALGLQLDVGEGGSKAYAMNAARRDERDSGFGKRMAALGLGDNALKTGLGAVSGGLSGLLSKEQLANSRAATAAQTSVAMSGINARMAEAEADRALRERGMTEDARRYDQGFSRDVYRDDRNFGRSVYADDRNFGRRTFEDDRSFGRGVYTDDRNHDFNVWRANTGNDRYDDQRDDQRWQNIGSGVRTGLDIYNAWNGSGAGGNSNWAAAGGAGYDWGDWQLKDGGKVRAKVRARGLTDYAHGGEVKGPGDGTVDTVPAMLADGEMVVNAEATAYLDKVAPGLLDKANKKGLAIRKMRSSRAAMRGLEV